MPSPVGNAYQVGSGLTIYAGRSAAVAGTGVTINSLPDYTFYQRNDSDSRTVSLTGSCTGNPSLIEWRLVDYYTGLARTSWTTLITKPAASFNANVTYPRGGWDKIEIRDGVNTSLTSSTTTRSGVGIAVLLYGQSNMHLRPGNGVKRPLGDKRAMFLNASNVLERVGNINDLRAANLESDQTGYGTGGGYIQDVGKAGDGFVYMANLTAQAMNCPVLLIERAVNGQTIDLLTTGANWDAMAAAVAAAGGDFEAAIWHQGESNANGTTTASMVTKLGTLHSKLKTLNGRTNANFRFGVASLGVGSFGGSVEGDFGRMREAHRQYANNTAGAFYYATAHTGYTGDGVHLTAASISEIDRRGARNLIASLGVGTVSVGPRVTGATRDGQNVILAIAHSGGTLLTDGAGGTGTALTGFQIYDDGASGAVIEVSATSFPSASSISLTMATTPVGPLRVAYAMANNPHNTGNSATGVPIAASIPCDNATYHNSTVGCPLQPFAAISVS
jgi:hypothetical protein